MHHNPQAHLNMLTEEFDRRLDMFQRRDQDRAYVCTAHELNNQQYRVVRISDAPSVGVAFFNKHKIVVSTTIAPRLDEAECLGWLMRGQRLIEKEHIERLLFSIEEFQAGHTQTPCTKIKDNAAVFVEAYILPTAGRDRRSDKPYVWKCWREDQPKVGEKVPVMLNGYHRILQVEGVTTSNKSGYRGEIKWLPFSTITARYAATKNTNPLAHETAILIKRVKTFLSEIDNAPNPYF